MFAINMRILSMAKSHKFLDIVSYARNLFSKLISIIMKDKNVRTFPPFTR